MVYRFRIYDGITGDNLVIEGETIEELQKIAKEETERRGWKNCWSMRLWVISMEFYLTRSSDYGKNSEKI